MHKIAGGVGEVEDNYVVKECGCGKKSGSKVAIG